MGFRVSVSLHPAIQATGRLTFAPAGLTPAEHTSLHWTHRRIQLAQQLDEQASGVITLAARRSSSSKNTALSDYLSPNAPLALRHRAWPLITLAIAVAVNLAWVGLLAYWLAKLL